MPWLKNILTASILTIFGVALLLNLNGQPTKSPAGELARYKHLDTATKVKLVGVWGAGEEEPTWPNTVALSRDGKTGLSIRQGNFLQDDKVPDSSIAQWDVERGILVREFKIAEAAATAVALSADGKRGFTGTHAFDKDRKIKAGLLVLDLVAGKETALPSPDLSVVYHVAISPDGTRGAVGDLVGSIQIWDLDRRQRLTVFKVANQNQNTTGLIYSPDGKQLLVGDQVGGLRLFDADTGKETKSLAAQGQAVWIAMSGDGKRVFNVGFDQSICVLAADTGKEIKTFGKGNDKNTLVGFGLSTDGKKAVLILRPHQAANRADSFVHCFDVDSNKELWKTQFDLNRHVAFSFPPDGKHVLLGGGANPFVLLDLADGKVVRAWGGHKGAITALAVDANDNVWSAGVDRSIKLWDAKGKELKTLLGHKETVTALALAGDKLVSGSADKTLKIWDTKSGKDLHTLTGHTGNVSSVAVTPDGKRVVSGGGDRMVRIWEVATAKELHALTGHGDNVNAVVVSPDGKWIASASDDNRILLWPSEPKQDVDPTEMAGHERQVTSLTFTSDGKHLIAGSQDKTITLWDVASAKKVKTFTGHKNWVQALAVQGNMLFSASDDLTMRLWNVQTGKEVEALDFGRAQDLARCFAFQRNPRTLLVGTAAGVILRFEIK